MCKSVKTSEKQEVNAVLDGWTRYCKKGGTVEMKAERQPWLPTCHQLALLRCLRLTEHPQSPQRDPEDIRRDSETIRFRFPDYSSNKEKRLEGHTERTRSQRGWKIYNKSLQPEDEGGRLKSYLENRIKDLSEQLDGVMMGGGVSQ